MIFDVHGHVGSWFFPMAIGSADVNVELCERFGITLQVVSSSLAIAYDFREGNRAIARVLDGRPGLYGYVVLNPHYPEASAEELAHWLGTGDFIGVKLHPAYTRSRIASAGMRELWAIIAQAGVPVLIHTWDDDVTALPDVLASHPSLRIIAAHMGGPRWDVAIEAAAACPRLYLEPCGTVAHRGKLERALERVRVQQLLFGTDAPLIHPLYSLGMMDDTPMPADVRRRIYWDNAVELFGIDEPRRDGGHRKERNR